MVTRFEFATAQRIVFGAGTLAEAGHLAEGLGSRALLVTGRDQGRSVRLAGLLAAQGMAVERFAVSGEPTVNLVQSGVDLARGAGVDVVVAFGGGSALDAGKAIAALVPNAGDPFRYLEVVGQGRSLEAQPLPCLAIPTTAGTGSEVTRNAVLAAEGAKVSLRHPWMLPRIALVDPELTLDLPPDITAATGLDALTQLIEPFLSSRANPVTDALCLEGLRRAAGALPRACRDGRDLEARGDMALASLLGGLALANAGLGAVHGLAGPLGGLRPVPHGVACAALLAHVLELNLRKLRREGNREASVERFGRLAQVLTGRPDAGPEEGVRWVGALVAELRIPRLAAYGLTQDDLRPLAERAAKASSMAANPVPLDREELAGLLAKAL